VAVLLARGFQARPLAHRGLSLRTEPVAESRLGKGAARSQKYVAERLNRPRSQRPAARDGRTWRFRSPPLQRIQRAPRGCAAATTFPRAPAVCDRRPLLTGDAGSRISSLRTAGLVLSGSRLPGGCMRRATPEKVGPMSLTPSSPLRQAWAFESIRSRRRSDDAAGDARAVPRPGDAARG
jgi:hypothetical protein